MKAKYYVSYAHTAGYGSIEITLAVPITTFQQIVDIREHIAKTNGLGDIVILFYTRLGEIK